MIHGGRLHELRYDPVWFPRDPAGRSATGAGAGQAARLDLSGSNNVCFTIDDVVDCKVDYISETARRTYRVEVHLLFPQSEAEPSPCG